jgi:hypothetical protein
MTLGRFIAVFVLLLAAVSAEAGACGTPTANDGYEQLDSGYRALYNLAFDQGERIFTLWAREHPTNPLGPVSRASGYLFREFDRLQVLRTELFAEDEAFRSRGKLSPNSELRARFKQQLAVADQLADAMLMQNAFATDALLAKTLVSGLQADYAALIEKRDGASLSHTKEGRRWAARLLLADPSCHDAYLALGIENYLVASKPAVMRWLAQLAGANADREQGIRELSLAAHNGRFLKPFAKLLLAVAAIRDHDAAKARALLGDLQQEFPGNRLFSYELARLNNHRGSARGMD